MLSKTIIQIAASILLHGSIVGAVMAFSSGGFATEEKVYRVTLAEFSAPASSPAAPAPSLPQAEPPGPEAAKPEPLMEPPKPKPIAEKPPEAKTKTISTRKAAEKKKPAEKTQSAPPLKTASVAPAGAAMNSGVATMNIGGLAAYGVDTVDQRPSIVKRVVPEYPQKARRMNVQGKVFVRLVVDMTGHPKECKIHQADPAGYFEDAALNAARKTRFVPGKVKGQPVNTVVLVPFVFALR